MMIKANYSDQNLIQIREIYKLTNQIFSGFVIFVVAQKGWARAAEAEMREEGTQ